MRNVGEDRRSFNSPFNVKRVQQPEGISFEFWMQIWAVGTRGACPTRRFFGCCQEGKRKKKRRLTATLCAADIVKVHTASSPLLLLLRLGTLLIINYTSNRHLCESSSLCGTTGGAFHERNCVALACCRVKFWIWPVFGSMETPPPLPES
jgi:hypothetical protein